MRLSPQDLVAWAEFIYETDPRVRFQLEEAGKDRAESILQLALDLHPAFS